MKYLFPIIPWATGLVFYVILEVILSNSQGFYYLAPILGVIIILAVWRLVEQKLLSLKLWRYLLTPLIFSAGALTFFLFLEGGYFRHFFIIGCAVLLWAYLEVIYLRFHSRPKYEPYALENITIHLDLAAVFLVASSFFNFSIFLDIGQLSLVLVFAAIIALLVLQLIWASGTTLSVSWHYLLVITLITTELFYVAGLLPTSVYVNGLLVTLGYYLISGLARNWLLDIREEKVVRRYLVISGVSLVLILLTAKWF